MLSKLKALLTNFPATIPTVLNLCGVLLIAIGISMLPINLSLRFITFGIFAVFAGYAYNK